MPGFRDPYWRAIQVAAVVVVAAGTALAWSAAGPLVGLGVGATLALLAWLVSRAF